MFSFCLLILFTLSHRNVSSQDTLNIERVSFEEPIHEEESSMEENDIVMETSVEYV